MSIRTFPLLVAAFLLPHFQASTFAEPPKESPLSPRDRAYLDALFRDFLFDPTGAERVRAKVPQYGLYSFGSVDAKFREGWLVKKKDSASRIFFTDGFSIAAPSPDQIQVIDFLAPIKKFFNTRQPPEEETGPWLLRTWDETIGDSEKPITLAAWLYRFGHHEYARQMLGIARALDGTDPTGRLRSSLSDDALQNMCSSFWLEKDEFAEAYATTLKRLCRTKDEKSSLQADSLLKEIERRRMKSNPAKRKSSRLPEEFSTWTKSRKLDFLIMSLDEVHGQIAGIYNSHVSISFTGDRVFNELLDLGEAAIPALIDVLEQDTRMIRLPILDGPFPRQTGEFHQVDRPALDAIYAILQTSRFPEVPDGKPVVGEREINAARIRAYWMKYGKLDFDKRMMHILTDHEQPEVAWRTAAANLARRSEESNGRAEFTSGIPALRPIVRRFRNPTIADAILTAMDRERGIQESQGGHNGSFHGWPGTQQMYLDHLVTLGDSRIGPVLDRRAAGSQDSDVRRRFALAAMKLGTLSEWTRFCRDVERGQVALKSAATKDSNFSNRSREEEELTRIVSALVRSKSSAADHAIQVLTDSLHPYYSSASKLVLHPITAWTESDSPWNSHPAFLRILRGGMTDNTPTGVRHNIRIVERQNGPTGWTVGTVERFLSPEEWKSGVFRKTADELKRHRCASLLSDYIAGMPEFELLHQRFAQELAGVLSTYDRFAGHFRTMTWYERDRIRMGFVRPGFIPDIRQLPRPATLADVKAGRAVFELGGKGKLTEMKLPAWLLLKSEAKKKYPAFGLVVQAETSHDGKPVYGVIFRHDIRAVQADEVERLEAYEKK